MPKVKRNDLKPTLACIIREMSAEPEEQCEKIAGEIVELLEEQPTHPGLVKIEEKEITPEQLHEWYLIAVGWLQRDGTDDKNYNPNAIKQYAELTEDQKYIDKYIAKRINAHFGTPAGMDETKE